MQAKGVILTLALLGLAGVGFAVAKSKSSKLVVNTFQNADGTWSYLLETPSGDTVAQPNRGEFFGTEEAARAAGNAAIAKQG